jgi:hypothetical protein
MPDPIMLTHQPALTSIKPHEKLDVAGRRSRRCVMGSGDTPAQFVAD